MHMDIVKGRNERGCCRTSGKQSYRPKGKHRGISNLHSYQGDATDLKRFVDDTFDLTLSLGPMYHLYESDEVNSAIDEAIRVTKPGGVIMFAFLSVFGIMYANYFNGNWAAGQESSLVYLRQEIKDTVLAMSIL